ncbi:MAG: efflux RND transporter periplasmic adaptor subunit [Acidobacteriota bacterium]
MKPLPAHRAPGRGSAEILLALATLFLIGCGKAPERQIETKSAPVAVKAIAVSPAEWPVTYEATGTVRARTAAVISSKVMGYVREVTVRAGDRVRQGQLLVRLDARDLEAAWRQAQAALNEARSAVPEADNAVAAARASLDLAQVTHRRLEDLFQKKSVSNQEFDEASAKLKLAQANLAMAEARRKQLAAKIEQAQEAVNAADIMRGYAEIAAPFAGAVTDKAVEPGSLAVPGQPLLTLEREGAFRLEAAVEESRLGAIRLGQAATIRLEALDRTLDGRVSEIVPAVDAAARSFLVKIDLPPLEQLRSGVFGRALFAVGRRKVLAVPQAAVVERGQLVSVLVAEEGQARARLVTLGERSGDQVEVLSGLNAGDRVIVPVPAALANGARVEARP